MSNLPEKISGGILVGLLSLSTWGIYRVAERLAEDIVIQERDVYSYIEGGVYRFIDIPKVVVHNYTPGSISLTILIGLAIIVGSFAVWKVVDHIIDDEDNSWWRRGSSYEWKNEAVVTPESRETK